MSVEAKRNERRRTPLMLAAFRGDLLSVRGFLAAGADVNARDGDGLTALMYAARGGQAAVVHFLLLRGANVYARAKNGWTAKRAAQAGFHHDVEQMLRHAESEPVDEATSNAA